MEQFITKYIDVYYLLAFMGLTYAFKGGLELLILKIIRMRKMSGSVTTFIIGSLVAIPFWCCFGNDKMNLFVTWCVGTAIHDLLIKHLIGLVKKNLQNKNS